MLPSSQASQIPRCSALSAAGPCKPASSRSTGILVRLPVFSISYCIHLTLNMGVLHTATASLKGTWGFALKLHYHMSCWLLDRELLQTCSEVKGLIGSASSQTGSRNMYCATQTIVLPRRPRQSRGPRARCALRGLHQPRRTSHLRQPPRRFTSGQPLLTAKSASVGRLHWLAPHQQAEAPQKQAHRSASGKSHLSIAQLQAPSRQQQM